MLWYYWDTLYPKRILTASFWSNIPDSPVHKQKILLISLCRWLDEWLAKRLGLKKKAIYFLPWCALVHYTRNCFSLASFNWAYAGSFCFLNSAMEEFEVHIGFFFFLLNLSLVKVHYWARMRISSLIIYYPVDVSWTWIVASLMELVFKYPNFSPIYLLIFCFFVDIISETFSFRCNFIYPFRQRLNLSSLRSTKSFVKKKKNSTKRVLFVDDSNNIMFK